jgi:hypothetical protein
MEIDWRSHKQKSTARCTTDAEYYAFGIGCMRLARVIHLMTELGIDKHKPIIFSDSQSMIASIRNRVYHGTRVAHIATSIAHEMR